ncbi:MAG: peptidoglycan DD-metalloendopeptidase family protein [Planctomycetota bacterium]
MMRPRTTILALLLVGLAAGAAHSGPAHPSIGVCTRKEEFAKRQKALDGLVAALSATGKESKAKGLRKKLVKAAEKDIECLMRYREKALVPVFAGVVKSSRRWFTRTRALYAIKMLGDRAGVPAAIDALSDKHDMVREAAAAALGHLGGEEAVKALVARREKEKDPFVAATIEAAHKLATAAKRPYDVYAGGEVWKEDLVGPEGARRVAWAWVVKGKKLFNRYDAKTLEVPVATEFSYPIARYEEDLFAGYPRNSFGAGGTHAGEDCAWFREGSGYYAIADGVVRMVQGGGGDWGFLVAIEHRLADGRYLTAVYGHMAWDVLVEPGDLVTAGQRIGSQGLSTSVENGGYGSHVHFGIGDGPFRRPDGVAAGDEVTVDLEDGKTARLPVLRLVYAAEKKNSFGWPLTAMVVRRPDGTEQTVVVPEQELSHEIRWFQAYVKDCRGWKNPQKLLPELVNGKK